MMQAVLMYKSLINLHDSGSYTHTHGAGGGVARGGKDRQETREG